MDKDLVSRNRLWDTLSANALSSYLLMVVSALVLVALGVGHDNPCLSIARYYLLAFIAIVAWVQFFNGKDLEYALQIKYSDDAVERMRWIGCWNKKLFIAGVVIYTIGVIFSAFGLGLLNG